METPDIRYILYRAVALIALLVALLFAWGFFKKLQRRAQIVDELRSITSDSSFFQQFYAADAEKNLVKAIGLIAEINTLGVPPEKSINKGIGIKSGLFDEEMESKQDNPRDILIRNCLRTNYENFLKLGYLADFQTLSAMKNGELGRIPSGPHQGRKADIACLIDPSISPGMEKVIANLVIRPPTEQEHLTDIETAAAKNLARNLYLAGVIERPVRDRIVDALSEPRNHQPPPKSPEASPMR